MGYRGYTLLEVLVVVVILGVMSGFAVLALRGASDAERLSEAADRVAALVRLQCEEALLGNRAMRMRLDEAGYRFEVATRSGWVGHERDVFRQRAWPVRLAVRLEVDGADVGAGVAGNDGIYCLPTGELTPFELELASPDAGTSWVRATASGIVRRTGDRG